MAPRIAWLESASSPARGLVGRVASVGVRVSAAGALVRRARGLADALDASTREKATAEEMTIITLSR